MIKQSEVAHFAKGLKATIKESGITQEKFAEGVTSKVNLSNVLNGSGGTSDKMREAMAKKAGMSVEELIAVGRMAEGVHTFPSTRRSVQAPLADTETAELTSEELAGMSTIELLSKLNEATNMVTTSISIHHKTIATMLKSLIEQRECLIAHVDANQSVLNSLETPICVLDRQCVVVECNRAATEKYGMYPGPHDFAELSVLVEQVFVSGKPGHTELDKTTKVCAYPILDARGITKQVVLTYYTK